MMTVEELRAVGKKLSPQALRIMRELRRPRGSHLGWTFTMSGGALTPEDGSVQGTHQTAASLVRKGLLIKTKGSGASGRLIVCYELSRDGVHLVDEIDPQWSFLTDRERRTL